MNPFRIWGAICWCSWLVGIGIPVAQCELARTAEEHDEYVRVAKGTGNWSYADDAAEYERLRRDGEPDGDKVTGTVILGFFALLVLSVLICAGIWQLAKSKYAEGGGLLAVGLIPLAGLIGWGLWKRFKT